MATRNIPRQRLIKWLLVLASCGILLRIIIRTRSQIGDVFSFWTNRNCRYTDADLQNELVKVGKIISEAHRHARSARTISALVRAFNYIENRTRVKTDHHSKRGQPPMSTPESASSEKPDVCPEVYKGMLDFGYFERGWELENCDSKAFENIVTLVLNAWAYTSREVLELIEQIRLEYPKLKLLISANPSTELRKQSQLDGNLTIYTNLGPFSWMSLIREVNTKYLVALRDVRRFSNQTRLERLISVSNRFNVSIVGGATVGHNGHWWHGCYQVLLRNYSLKYEHGYEFSRDSCWFCDYLSGPFLARTNHLKTIMSSVGVHESDLVFSDLFLSATSKHEVTVMGCPDVMFHIDVITIEKQETRQLWLPLAKTFVLNRIMSYSGAIFNFSCKDIGLSCTGFDTYKGKLVPPCCFELLNICLKALMDYCQKHDVFIDIRFGTLLGALKFKKALPWDIDGDFQYFRGNHSTIVKSISVLSKRGCVFSPAEVYGTMNANGWYVDVTAISLTPSLAYRQRSGYNQTYVLFDGMWVNAPPNPGKMVRLQYVHDIYKHVNPHRHTGKDLQSIYVSEKFMKCPKGAISHSCLDEYYSDGSLQFTSP